MESLKVALFLAIKAVTRSNPGITVLTILMLILASLNLLFVPGLVNGIVQSANDKLKDTYVGDIIVNGKGNSPYISDVAELTGQIESIPGVAAVTPRNSMAAEISFEDEHTNCTVRGIEPELDAKVFTIYRYIVEGEYLQADDKDEILLGIQVSGSDKVELELYSNSLKKVHAGDMVAVTYTNGTRKSYHVKGIFYTEFLQSDFQAFITQTEFDLINPAVKGKAYTLNIKTEPGYKYALIIGEIKRIHQNLSFQTWEDAAGIIRSMTTSFNMINGILVLVNMLVAGITVFIVTYIDLVNKRRQIGIERALGITPQAIVISYVLRAVFYAVFAIIISYFIFKYLIIPIEAKYPFHFPFGDVRLVLNQVLLLRSTIIIICVAIVAAFLPVFNTIRMKLLDAIWG